MTEATDLQALEDLRASRGWAIIRARMEAEILQAARNLGTTSALPPSAVDFQRGAIWAADQLVGIPNRLIQELQTQLAINQGKSHVR